ncbi:olfactory receptor 1N2 [Gadus morhua]|uniref:olfactory receptor 1N2 n=1 Tax=Gadus morhua TaxID=8049 RepID=UPI0011B6BF6C|nr:olfactory receptor 1N2-like [Gadus morhua]
MENQTWSGDVLLLEGLKVTPQYSFPVFFLLLLLYIFIMVSNIGLTVLICMERSLHQPMYLLFCNLSINDVLGATAIIPHLLSNIFTASANRYISYIGCVIQAFFFHLHIGTSLSVLMIGLSVRLSRCRRKISYPFCDNASLFKLSCDSILINNIYGLGYTVVLLGSSLGSTVLTYVKIAIACLTSKNRVLNRRALQTCTTHLALYLIMMVSGLSSVALHRFAYLAEQGKVASILIMVVPPALNAVIYGLQIKQIRQKIVALFNKNKVTSMEMH